MTTKIKTFGGNIGIGTTDPKDFNLNVNGSLKTSSLVVNGVQNAQVPIGLIAPWYGSSDSIPSGWALCDGQSHPRTDGAGDITTPNLQTKFIRGATGNAPSSLVATGRTGGNNNVTLSTDDLLARHYHGVTVDTGYANHSHGGSQDNAQHTHGGNSNQSNANHDHETAQQTSVNHGHGGNSDSSNAYHSHGSAQSEALHGHGTTTGYAPHTHSIRDGRGFVYSLSGSSTQFFGHENPQVVSSYSNAPHNHGRSNNTQSPHSHGVTGYSNSGDHTHGIANANTPHLHSTSNNAAVHDHSTPQVDAAHTHSVTAVDALHGHTGSSSNTGQATPFSVLNEYYALFYIMKI
jgi:hypothetical protein